MKKESAFTLIELMIVVNILGLLTCVFAFSYQAYMPRYRLYQAVQELETTLQQARLNSVRRQVPIAVSFTLTGGTPGTYTVFTDEVVTNGLLEAGETVLKRVVIPGSLDFYSAPPGAIVLTPRGFTPPGGGGDCYIRSNVMDDGGNRLDEYRGVRFSTTGSSRIIRSGDAGVTWQ